MEFIDCSEEILNQNADHQPLSLHRQRILEAQIRDSEIDVDGQLLSTADNFDTSVEKVPST